MSGTASSLHHQTSLDDALDERRRGDHTAAPANGDTSPVCEQFQRAKINEAEINGEDKNGSRSVCDPAFLRTTDPRVKPAGEACHAWGSAD
jgi:hypothetical protein